MHLRMLFSEAIREKSMKNTVSLYLVYRRSIGIDCPSNGALFNSSNLPDKVFDEFVKDTQTRFVVEV